MILVVYMLTMIAGVYMHAQADSVAVSQLLQHVLAVAIKLLYGWVRKYFALQQLLNLWLLHRTAYPTETLSPTRYGVASASTPSSSPACYAQQCFDHMDIVALAEHMRCEGMTKCMSCKPPGFETCFSHGTVDHQLHAAYMHGLLALLAGKQVALGLGSFQIILPKVPQQSLRIHVTENYIRYRHHFLKKRSYMLERRSGIWIRPRDGFSLMNIRQPSMWSCRNCSTANWL
jgi:hypothetical protein